MCVSMTANHQTCQKCGSPVTPGMKFCESCGAKIEALPSCLTCGAALAPDVKFCESCGAPVAPIAAPTPPVVAPVVAPPVSKAPETPPVPEVKQPVEPSAKVEEKTAPAPAPKEKPVVPEPSAKVEEKTAPAPVPKEKTVVPEPSAKVEEKPVPAPAPVKEIQKTLKKVEDAPKETGPKKPMSPTTMIIAGVIILALLGAVVFFVVMPMLSAPGTPSQNQQPPATSAPGSSEGAPAATGATSQSVTVPLTAGPTDVPPNNRALIIDVERDAISQIITVTFQGGEGQYGVRELVVTLTRSDGTVETKSFKPDNRGVFITLKGTEKADRVEVTANFYNGETYKIVDKVFEYKKRVGSY